MPIYKGTFCEFSYDEFISSCKHKKPTICFVKTKKGKVFGAYTELPWDTSIHWITGDSNNFVFKFDDEELIIDRSKFDPSTPFIFVLPATKFIEYAGE